MEILKSVQICMEKAVDNLKALNIDPANIRCIGIANQRETTVVWDKLTGKPLHNAIVWLDLRTASTVDKLIASTPQKSKDVLRSYCGLPITTYFSAVKLKWLIDNDEKVRQAIAEDRCMFGTVDTWLLWNLTGGPKGGKHITDVTNASRTMLMNIHNLRWDDYLCKFFDVPKSILPEIRSCSEIYGSLSNGPLKGLPISGILGDQQAALIWHRLFSANEYRYTGGAIAIAGACVRWLRDNLGLIKTSEEIEKLASNVDSTHGCYFVPAFSGLFCPYWQADARGIICGLTQFTNKDHIARAALEAVCFQTREVDGGMTANNLLMQLQADLMGINVVRPSMPETTALGAAMAAGAADGVSIWNLETSDLTKITTDTFSPSIGPSGKYSVFFTKF
ncbi:hypothetical protein KUTeg_006370 [Tegillarca granosa]|uniref:glycerol kinase n=1 Tax=Tegillarca granosa TaxID=220873 RepID=A0ABQ9FGA7_TEGGR|nr:hypothetical protein KUTeg_006370 [Tegillarca granosa]